MPYACRQSCKKKKPLQVFLFSCQGLQYTPMLSHNRILNDNLKKILSASEMTPHTVSKSYRKDEKNTSFQSDLILALFTVPSAVVQPVGEVGLHVQAHPVCEHYPDTAAGVRGESTNTIHCALLQEDTGCWHHLARTGTSLVRIKEQKWIFRSLHESEQDACWLAFLEFVIW